MPLSQIAESTAQNLGSKRRGTLAVVYLRPESSLRNVLITSTNNSELQVWRCAEWRKPQSRCVLLFVLSSLDQTVNRHPQVPVSPAQYLFGGEKEASTSLENPPSRSWALANKQF